MSKIKILSINDSHNISYSGFRNLFIFTAGFEERCVAFLREYSKALFNQCHVLMINYPEINQNWQEEIAYLIKHNNFSFQIVNDIRYLSNEIRIYKPEKIFIDISSMERHQLFKVLNIVDEFGINFNIIYTEAENYYPLHEFYKELIDNSHNNYELAFDKYLDNERSQLVYSYECELFEDNDFLGQPEPGHPVLLVSFFGFKRSRLQLLLQSFEVDRKIFILSEPLREDLKWRKELQKIINYDLYQKNRPFVKELKTFDIVGSYKFLETNLCDDYIYLKNNVILSPLGSKVQTIACFFFWRNHKEISIVFSLPKKYYSDKYSIGYRDTFLFTYDFLNSNFKKEWKQSALISY